MRSSRIWSAFLCYALSHHTRISGRIALFLRRQIIKVADPALAYRLSSGCSIIIPLSHNLPLYKLAHKNYDTAIVRISRFLSRNKERVTIIDVGANVGDTAAVLLASVNCRVIAIEGNPKFLPYLKRNLEVYDARATIVPIFVGAPGIVSATVSTSGGTASLKVGVDSTLALRSLPSVVSELGLDRIDLIKIDTDGYDIEVLISSVDWLSVEKPTLFFEFYPNLFSQVTKDGWRIFSILERTGYIGAIIYLNTGAYLRSFDLKNAAHIEELKAFVCSSDANSYVDILVFSDEEKLSKFKATELQYFCEATLPEQEAQSGRI